jgi:hypothetical protein
MLIGYQRLTKSKFQVHPSKVIDILSQQQPVQRKALHKPFSPKMIPLTFSQKIYLSFWWLNNKTKLLETTYHISSSKFHLKAVQNRRIFTREWTRIKFYVGKISWTWMVSMNVNGECEAEWEQRKGRVFWRACAEASKLEERASSFCLGTEFARRCIAVFVGTVDVWMQRFEVFGNLLIF